MIIPRNKLCTFHLTIIYIQRNILSCNIIEKNHLATWGLEPASPVSVNRPMLWSRPSCIPKKVI